MCGLKAHWHDVNLFGYARGRQVSDELDVAGYQSTAMPCRSSGAHPRSVLMVVLAVYYWRINKVRSPLGVSKNSINACADAIPQNSFVWGAEDSRQVNRDRIVRHNPPARILNQS
jgi:hypothetical protein